MHFVCHFFFALGCLTLLTITGHAQPKYPPPPPPSQYKTVASLEKKDEQAASDSFTTGWTGSVSIFTAALQRKRASDSAQISSETDYKNKKTFLLLPGGGIGYGLQSIKTRLYTDIGELGFVVGATTYLGIFKVDVIAGAPFNLKNPPFNMGQSAWENPYLLNQPRTATKVWIGNRLRLSLNVNKLVNISYDTHKRIYDSDTLGEKYPDLARDATNSELQLKTGIPLYLDGNKLSVILGLGLTKETHQALGRASSYDGQGSTMGLMVNLFARHLFMTSVRQASNTYRAAVTNPQINMDIFKGYKRRDTIRHYNLTYICKGVYWPKLSMLFLLDSSEQNSNVDYHDELNQSAAIVATYNFAF